MSSGSHRYYKFLTEMFPNQFNTVPRIIIWTIVFLLDTALVIWCASLIGVPVLETANNRLSLIIYLVIAFILFTVESWIYNLIKHS